MIAILISLLIYSSVIPVLASENASSNACPVMLQARRIITISAGDFIERTRQQQIACIHKSELRERSLEFEEILQWDVHTLFEGKFCADYSAFYFQIRKTSLISSIGAWERCLYVRIFVTQLYFCSSLGSRCEQIELDHSEEEVFNMDGP